MKERRENSELKEPQEVEELDLVSITKRVAIKVAFELFVQKDKSYLL